MVEIVKIRSVEASAPVVWAELSDSDAVGELMQLLSNDKAPAAS